MKTKYLEFFWVRVELKFQKVNHLALEHAYSRLIGIKSERQKEPKCSKIVREKTLRESTSPIRWGTKFYSKVITPGYFVRANAKIRGHTLYYRSLKISYIVSPMRIVERHPQ